MTSARAYLSLPADWAQRPLTDDDLFEGVVDLVVRDDDRHHGGLVLLSCHANGRLMEVLPLEEVRLDPMPAPQRIEQAVAAVLRALSAVRVPGVVLVLARPGRPVATPGDRRVHAVVEALCTPPQPALLGFAVATPEGVLALQPRVSAGSATNEARDAGNQDEPGTTPLTRRAS